MIFKDRFDAGKRLAEAVFAQLGTQPSVVFGLPRGGVVVASIVASRLRAPTDVVVTKKIGHQFNPEFALGAMAEGGVLVLDHDETAHVSWQWLEDEKAARLN